MELSRKCVDTMELGNLEEPLKKVLAVSAMNQKNIVMGRSRFS